MTHNKLGRQGSLLLQQALNVVIGTLNLVATLVINTQTAGIPPALTGVMGELVQMRPINLVFRDDSKNSTHILFAGYSVRSTSHSKRFVIPDGLPIVVDKARVPPVSQTGSCARVA